MWSKQLFYYSEHILHGIHCSLSVYSGNQMSSEICTIFPFTKVPWVECAGRGSTYTKVHTPSLPLVQVDGPEALEPVRGLACSFNLYTLILWLIWAAATGGTIVKVCGKTLESFTLGLLVSLQSRCLLDVSSEIVDTVVVLVALILVTVLICRWFPTRKGNG